MRHFDGQTGPHTFVWREPEVCTTFASRLVGRLLRDFPLRIVKWRAFQEQDPAFPRTFYNTPIGSVVVQEFRQ